MVVGWQVGRSDEGYAVEVRMERDSNRRTLKFAEPGTGDF